MMSQPPKTYGQGLGVRSWREIGFQIWYPWRLDGPSVVYLRNFNAFDVKPGDHGWTQSYEWRCEYTEEERPKLPGFHDNGVLVRRAGPTSQKLFEPETATPGTRKSRA